MALTYAQFLADPSRENNYLVTCSCVKKSDASAATLRFANRQFDTGASDSPANTRFWPRLTGVPYRYASGEVPIGTLAHLPDTSGGEIVIGQVMGDYDTGDASHMVAESLSSIRDVTFLGRNVSILHGGSSGGQQLPFSSYTTVMAGQTDEALVGTADVTIPLRDRKSRFDTPLQDRVFRATGFCLYFDGAGDEVVVGTSSKFNFSSGPQTWEFWILIEANPGSDMYVITRFAGATDGYVVYVDTAGKINFATAQSGANQITTATTALIPMVWTHVAVAYNGGTTCLIYLDGELDKTGTGHTAPTANAARTLYFGRNNAGGNRFTGFLDDVRAWGVAVRTQSEIEDAYQRELTSTETTNLKGYWKLNEGTGSTTADTAPSPVSPDATVTGAVFRQSLTGETAGDSSLEGAVLLDAFGYHRAWEPIEVSTATRVYQVHSGSVNAISNTYEGGNALTAGTTYTAWSTFLAASTTAGQFDRLITAGGSYVRLGTAPVKPITCELQGDNAGGTYRTTAGAIYRYLVCNRGSNPLTDPTDLNTTSFTALDTDNSSVMGYGTKNQVTVGEVGDFLLRSIGAVSWFARNDGLLTVERFEGASGKTPVYTISERDVSLGTLEPVAVEPPTWKVEIQCRRNGKVHSQTDLSASANVTFARYLRREWEKVSRFANSVRRYYLGAQVLKIQTAFTTTANARTEADRLRVLLDGPARAYRMTLKNRFGDLDIMDGVYFHYQDGDKQGALQSRFGTSSSSKWIVLALEESGDNELIVTIWQEG